jgi:peptidyl-prolyl cis-trans isomerase SurA
MRMSKKTIILYLFVLSLSTFGYSQNDEVLFSVAGDEVTVSEFDYIYNKNNGDEADYTEQSLQEYLDLYVKFKLKVQRAKTLKLDTIKSLQRELEGYRKQLANSYLVDNEVSDNLIKEVFERKKSDLDVSHIMIVCDDKANDNAVDKAERRIKEIKKLLERGDDFVETAKKLSEDKQSAANGGRIGYITAMLPKGFYNLESAAYNTPVGETSDIFRTAIGFHIVKVNGKREALGEVEIAHILLRENKKGVAVAGIEDKIDSIHTALKNGAKFNELSATHSDDAKTKDRGGYIGFFGINKYEKAFESAAFALKNDGDISEPIKTQVGYHILKRLSKKDLNDFGKAQKQLKRVVSGAERFDIARESLIEKIKKDGGLKEQTTVLNNFKNSLGDDFLSFKWEVPTLKDQELLSFDSGQSATIQDFADYCKKQSKTRLRAGKNSKSAEVADNLYKMFIDDQAIKYEESNLENKYPEFKALMREYREGILLFEATEREVWNMASTDTVGLTAYYDQHKDRYQWKDRAKVVEYTLKTTNAKEIKKAYKQTKKKELKEAVAAVNKDKQMLSYRELTLDKENDKLSGVRKWKNGALTEPAVDIKNKRTTYYKIVEVMAPGTKKLSEARGYVISDYQDKLEKDWIEKLRSTYDVQINQEVFNGLIK